MCGSLPPRSRESQSEWRCQSVRPAKRGVCGRYRIMAVYCHLGCGPSILFTDAKRRFSLADTTQFSVSAIVGLSINLASPSPKCTFFFCRLVLQQSYTIQSPRTPNEPPHEPEPPTKHLVYQVGTSIRAGTRFPGYELPSLWRGTEARGKCGAAEIGGNGEDGWKVRAVVRMPSHDKIRPSTSPR